MGLFKDFLYMIGLTNELEVPDYKKNQSSIEQARGEISYMIQTAESYVRTAKSHSSSYKSSGNSTTAKMALDYYSSAMRMLDNCLSFYRANKPSLGCFFVQNERCYYSENYYANKPVDKYIYDRLYTLQNEKYRALRQYQDSLNSQNHMY